ncbi:hypothetical protein MASR1M74_28200 [Lentimicrobium sp.]
MEKAECVLILGEDLTNTAPMLALAVRQSVRQKPMNKLEELNIHSWDDKTVRDAMQQKKGPLFNITPAGTKLDELAKINVHTSPEAIARLGFGIAHFLDDANALPGNISEDDIQLAKSMAETIEQAENCVIISGTSALNQEVLKAAFNISEARAVQGKKTGLCLTFYEANSLGLTLIGGKSLSEMDTSVPQQTLIVLENDLYRKAPAKKVDELLASFENTIVVDSLMNTTSSKADYLLPAATIYESDGHLVNNEGRIQRFFKVFVKEEGEVLSGHQWIKMLSELTVENPLVTLNNIYDYSNSIEKKYPVFKGLAAYLLPVNYRQGAQKIAREPHRYSGRTATHANVTVHEPTPPIDDESPMSFSMEGFHGTPYAPLTPFFHSPGWNSVQAINKYQIEIGGELHRAIPQLHIYNQPNKNGKAPSRFYSITSGDAAASDGWKVLPLYHIFGSNELSVVDGGIKELTPMPYIGVHPETAKKMGWGEKTRVRPAGHPDHSGLPLRLCAEIPEECVGIPLGLEQMPFIKLEDWKSLID